jgi:hypothetical protein
LGKIISGHEKFCVTKDFGSKKRLLLKKLMSTTPKFQIKQKMFAKTKQNSSPSSSLRKLQLENITLQF